MTPPEPGLSVIIPAYNEQENIVPCLQQLRQALAESQLSFEIIVVNDGSTDNTLLGAQETRKSDTRVRIVDLGRNYGKAVALREGVKCAKGRLIAFFDADLQYDPHDLPRMAKLVGQGVDIVNGKRDYRAYGATRTSLSRIYNKLLQFVFRTGIADSNCGVKVLARKATDHDGLFKYGLPLLIPLLRIKGFRLAEMEVSLKNRTAGASKYYQDGSFLGGWRNFRDISFHTVMLLSLLTRFPSERRVQDFETFS